MASYIAILRKEERSSYGVSFPDLPGCVSAGSSLEEARKNAAEALALHLEGMAEEGLEIPPPSALDRVMADRENLDGVPFLVEIPGRETRSVRINITLPAGVLEEVDAYAAKRGSNRSAFLTIAVQNQIHARVVLRKEEVQKLERELHRDEPSRRQQILALLRKWRHEPGLTKDRSVDLLIDKILENPPRPRREHVPFVAHR